MFELPRPSSLPSLFSRRLKNRRPAVRRRRGDAQRAALERLEGRRVMALDFVAAFPNFGQFITDGATLREAPQQITIRFSPGSKIDPSTLSAIKIVRAGPDGLFAGGDDVNVTPTGFVGIVAVDDSPNENQVVIRFAENLPDDLYRLSITGGLKTLANGPVPVQSFRNGGRLDLNFRLDLGAQVVSVVPQPIVRQENGSLVQLRNTVVVHFNDNDPLLKASAETVGNYRLVEIDRDTGVDVAVRLPQSVTYETTDGPRRISRATLTFAADLGDKLYRLQIGGGDDDNNALGKATVVGALFKQPDDTPAFSTNSFLGDGLAGRKDVDLYKVALKAGATLTAAIRPDATLDAALRIFDAAGTQVAILASSGLGAPATLAYTASAAGDFFVGVSSKGNVSYLPGDEATASLGDTSGGYRLELSSTGLPATSDANSSFSTATPLGVLGAAGTTVNGAINVQGWLTTPLGLLLFPTQPGTVDEPGHREIPITAEGHEMPGSRLLLGSSAAVRFYNFKPDYGNVNGAPLVNLITETQKQRVREIFEIISAAVGVRFVETVGSGLTIAAGDIRAVNPLAPVPNGPSGIAGDKLVVVNASREWGQSESGGGWYSVAMHEICHALGLGHSYDLTSNMGGRDPADGVLPGDHDLVHLSVLYPKNGSDVDVYSFGIEADGKVSLETVVARPGQPVVSLADTAITLYREDPTTGVRTLIAQNDDFYGRDSFIGIDLLAQNPDRLPYKYYVTVASTGTAFDPSVEDSGNGGRTDGAYQLKLGFVPAAAALNTIVDRTNTPIDGDRDGRAGGVFDFWFQSSTAANTIYVDKVSPSPGSADGSIAKPFKTIEEGLAAVGTGTKVVRIVGNSPGNPASATPYLIGTSLTNEPLADGADFVVPENVTVMIDEGAVFKLRSQVIDVGSASSIVSRRGAALQVLGTPGNQVRFTSYHDDTMGGDSDGAGLERTGGQWGGIVMRADSDSATRRVFLNSISQADIRYGGGRVVVNGQDQAYAPIHLETSRPSLVFNTVRFSAGAALSADPNSFGETEFRRGPVVRGNVLTDNSINGMFVRIRTNLGQPIDTLDVPAAFVSKDVTYVMTENLLISGGAGGYKTLGLKASGKLTALSQWVPVDINVRDLTSGMTVSGLGIPSGSAITDIDLAGNRIKIDAIILTSANDVPLTIDTGTPYARAAGRLQVDPGVVVKLQGSRIELGGGTSQLFAEGDPQYRVIFTSASDNRFGAGGTFDVFGTQVSGPAAGDWGGIFVGATAQASIDNAYIAYGGGQTSIEGGFDRFSAIEVHQGQLRLANSRLENNAAGVSVSTRAGRGKNDAATIFVRGAQPVIVGNDFRQNAGAVISVNVNSLSDLQVPDPGRSTGAIARYAQYDDNSGPLVRANTLSSGGPSGSIGGMVVRGGEVLTEVVWDDTDIVHVVTSEIWVDNFHTATGLRLMSSSNASLVVKFLGADAGLTATGHATEIDDRIGGTVQVLGQPGFPVVLTSLADDTVGSSIDTLGLTVKDTNGDGPSVGAAGDWRGLRFLPYSNDRNVGIVRETEKGYTGGVDANRVPGTAQYLGVLAPNEKGGDDNRRLGFQVHGSISGDDTTDVDVYSFDGYAGSEVWIDIDKTSAALDTMVELLNASGTVLARSVDSQRDSLLSPGVRGIGSDLKKNFALGEDFYTQNPRDAGMRVILPGSVVEPVQTTQYFVRVRSQPRVGATATKTDLEAAVSNPALVRQGATNGRYELRIRLQQLDEKPGSTVRYADIRFPVVGIDVQGLPRHSPLLGENGEAGPNESLASAQYLGNLLATDRNVISVAGSLSSATDVDWYAVDLTYEDIQVIAGLSDGRKTWSTVFDIDYADGIRGDLTLSVFDSQGRLMFIGRDSDLTQGGAPDRTQLGRDTGLADLSKGSAGTRDPFIGPAQMPTGLAAGSQRYYVAVSSNEQLPSVLDATFKRSATNSLVRLEPINSVYRVVEDHIEGLGYRSGNKITGTDGQDYNFVPPYTGKIFDLPNLAAQTGAVTIDDIVVYTSQRSAADDLAMRSDGWLYSYKGVPSDATTAGQLSRVSIIRGSTPEVIGRDNIPNRPPLEYPELVVTPTNAGVTNTTRYALSTANVTAVNLLDRATLTGVVQYSQVIDGENFLGTWQFTTAANGTMAFTWQGDAPPPAALRSPISGQALTDGKIEIRWSGNVIIASAGDVKNPVLANVIYSVANPNALTTDRVDALAWRRAGTAATSFDRLFYSVPDVDVAGNETGVSRLYRARVENGDATPGAAADGGRFGRVGTLIQTGDNRLGLTTGMAFVGQTLYGVDDRGNLFTIDITNGQATLVRTVGAGPQFQGLTVGPQNVRGGFFANKLFAIDKSGWMYCFDTSGTLLNELDGGTTSQVFRGSRDGDGNPILGGDYTGLAFSPIDVNLWGFTTNRGSEAGHGVNVTLDDTRDGRYTANKTRPEERLGTASIYYGFTGTNLGVVSTTWAQDLRSNPGLANPTAALPAPGGTDTRSITTKPFSLDGYTYGDKPTLYFNYWIESGAASAYVELSYDGGANWFAIATNDHTRSRINDDNEILPAFPSVSSAISTVSNQYAQELFENTGWRQARIDIGNFAGASNIILKFSFFPVPKDDAPGPQQIEGMYIDDIIVGFAERGEIVTGAAPGQADFFAIGTPRATSVPQQNLEGAYQLEIRRGTEFGRLQSSTLTGVQIDSQWDNGKPPSLIDTNGARVRGVANGNASSENDGSQFRGDDNAPRQQGQFIIEGNSIVSASTYGIRIDAAAREAGTNAPAPGVVRNLVALNVDRLVPGVAVVNNIVSTSGVAGILFSGDPNEGPGALAAVPFGRIVNNTIYGGPTAQGVGVDVRDNAAPTLLNNLFANLATGVSVDASSARPMSNGTPFTVVGVSAFYNTTTQVTGVASSSPLVLSSDPFVNAAAGNFYPVAGSPVIDSSVNTLQERNVYQAVIAPLGIPVSPIISPARDLYGQLRLDDLSQPNAAGLGDNVFKDRGAVERADFSRPTASLFVPLDNGAADESSDVNVVRLRGANAENVTRFVLQLNVIGTAIDRTTVTSRAFTLSLNGVPLVENTDYVFRYMETTNRVVFESSAVFERGTYEIRVNQENVGGTMVNMIANLAGNRLLPNKPDATTTFVVGLVSPPGLPVNLQGTPASSAVALTWSAPSDDGASPITDYVVEYSTNGTSWTPFSDLVSATPGATVTGLTNGTAYFFRVAAVNAVGQGAFTQTLAPITPFVPAPAPVGLTATRGSRQVTLAWTAPTGAGFGTITDYRVEVSSDGGVTWTTFSDGVSPTPGATVTGLTNGTAYQFRVTTITGLGAGASAVASATPENAPAPVSLTAARGSRQVTLSWTAPTGGWFGTITDYRVEVSSDGGATWTTFSDGVSPTPGATVTGLTNGTAYQFRVTTITTDGAGASAVAGATPLAAPAPVSLVATPTSGQAVLTWTAPVTAPLFSAISDYRVEVSSDGGTTWTTVNDGVSPTPGATVTGLTNGVAYRFRVTSLTLDGAGDSATTPAVTPTGVPLAPRALTAVVGQQSIGVSWAAPTITEAGGLTITGYRVEFRPNNAPTSQPWTVFSTALPGTSTGTTVTGLLNGTSYVVRVAAQNARGLGAYATSAPITPQALPAAPTRLSGVAGAGVVNLAWAAPASPPGTPIIDYVIQWSTNGGATWTTVSDGVSTATTATVSVPAGVGYVFRVAAQTRAGTGAYSTPTSVITPTAPGAVPAAPTALSAARVSSGSVRLTWTAPPANSGGAVNGYVIQYRLSTSSTWTSVTVASTAVPQTISSLAAGRLYSFRVAARNLAGVGAFSSVVSATA